MWNKRERKRKLHEGELVEGKWSRVKDGVKRRKKEEGRKGRSKKGKAEYKGEEL